MILSVIFSHCKPVDVPLPLSPHLYHLPMTKSLLSLEEVRNTVKIFLIGSNLKDYTADCRIFHLAYVFI